ncbi:MAG: dTMP kinase, partial [Proteobacteria bacterium]|nr:dTMP kinase [Pseudomonadota bacterium]
STVAYQGYGRGLDPRLLHTLNEVAVGNDWPDLTLVLDLQTEIGLKRAMTRNIKDGLTVEEGRFEAESLAFHNRVREGYLTLAALHQDRIKIVDGALEPDQVFEQIRTLVDNQLTRS